MHHFLTIHFWLFQVVGKLPLIGALIVGLAVCQRARRRRPRVARLLGGVILCQLIYRTIGVRLLFLAFIAIVGSPENAASRRVIGTTLSIVDSTIEAVIWAIALWAVLGVNDWQNASTET